MDDEPAAPVDEMARFTAIREESLELIETTRSLVADMRVLLEECKEWRPVVPMPVVPRPAPSVSAEPSPRTQKKTSRRGSAAPRGQRGHVAKPK